MANPKQGNALTLPSAAFDNRTTLSPLLSSSTSPIKNPAGLTKDPPAPRDPYAVPRDPSPTGPAASNSHFSRVLSSDTTPVRPPEGMAVENVKSFPGAIATGILNGPPQGRTGLLYAAPAPAHTLPHTVPPSAYGDRVKDLAAKWDLSLFSSPDIAPPIAPHPSTHILPDLHVEAGLYRGLNVFPVVPSPLPNVHTLGAVTIKERKGVQKRYLAAAPTLLAEVGAYWDQEARKRDKETQSDPLPVDALPLPSSSSSAMPTLSEEPGNMTVGKGGILQREANPLNQNSTIILTESLPLQHALPAHAPTAGDQKEMAEGNGGPAGQNPPLTLTPSPVAATSPPPPTVHAPVPVQPAPALTNVPAPSTNTASAIPSPCLKCKERAQEAKRPSPPPPAPSPPPSSPPKPPSRHAQTDTEGLPLLPPTRQKSSLNRQSVVSEQTEVWEGDAGPPDNGDLLKNTYQVGAALFTQRAFFFYDLVSGRHARNPRARGSDFGVVLDGDAERWRKRQASKAIGSRSEGLPPSPRGREVVIEKGPSGRPVLLFKRHTDDTHTSCFAKDEAGLPLLVVPSDVLSTGDGASLVIGRDPHSAASGGCVSVLCNVRLRDVEAHKGSDPETGELRLVIEDGTDGAPLVLFRKADNKSAELKKGAGTDEEDENSGKLCTQMIDRDECGQPLKFRREMTEGVAGSETATDVIQVVGRARDGERYIVARYRRPRTREGNAETHQADNE
uniref:Uncharacterized protein n=1 Tax=Chromera velia CCMP2878 TaxID=1169474 RepID=A0A0G4IFS8_9ALVE|eukprot:Cvel_2504.t1-p1 / transcript=Cvel_2504.t1 / gene=Cvel_2504 / organism=Chromera_velia_CCMP2878 / gene_product=hypothetical protein / transcript_product=hypothetical protein / location=Cvel_scaffold98:105433-107962(+) / protein_length=728 / sequence_SO=supercontig / SO=protein_coding / is_pseudo=false